ncbi:MAG: methylthioribose-phosphate isomerase [Acidobacteriota bacterium]|jgi:methylthioribose-1-phosphate isomerase|nr:methylthioribose-phosphate isomerase [Acidobacteriota bacterium]
MTANVEPIRWRGDALELLDQRLLPREVRWVVCRDAGEVARAIRDMVVRGAPAIGVSAAYGIALASLRGDDVTAAAAELREARPTAVNLMWAVDRMLRARGGDLVAEADAIFREDVESNRRIGAFGAELLGEQTTILTHCNAGALATAGYGTALGVVRAAVEAGKRIAVFADETRPYLQGARLTAWELQQDGIDVTLITDNMAGHFFQQGQFDAVIVGADRIAANGDAANKIGTYTVAVLAHAHGVPFYVAAPISTIDPDCANGTLIPIEERSADEVTSIGGKSIAPDGISVRHPAFDVTPARLISAIITDRGVLRAPFDESIRRALASQA